MPALEEVWREALDHDVAPSDELKRPFTTSRAVEVDHRTSLPGRKVTKEHPVHLTVMSDGARNRPGSEGMATRRFQLQNVRARVREKLGTVGAGDAVRDVKNAKATEGVERPAARRYEGVAGPGRTTRWQGSDRGSDGGARCWPPGPD